MTAADPTGAAGFLARYEGLKRRLPGDPALREAAAELFRRLGLPGTSSGRREEAWKYTNLRPLAESAFHEPLTLRADGQTLERVPRLAPARLVFIDGRYRPDLSDPAAGMAAGVSFATFAEQPEFGTLARPERDPQVALNTMLAEDGAVIAVPDNTDGGIVQVLSLASDAPGHATASHPRHSVRLGRGARLTLVETVLGDGVYLHNAVAEVHVGQGAALSHVRLQDESRAAFHLCTTYAEIAEGGSYDSFVLSLGGRVARAETHARLAGPDGAVHLSGAQLLTGTQLADVTTVVRHDAPRCASRQTVRNVLAGRSRGVFQGRIEVARGAQKTDGYQMSRALLLSPDAEIDTKPELEIFADDVKCSHGASVGELDAEQLFYLRSRGVPEPTARAMLVRAFLAEALESVANDTTRAALESAVERWWENQAA